MFGISAIVSAVVTHQDLIRHQAELRVKRRSSMTPEQLAADDKYELEERRHQEICRAIRDSRAEVKVYNHLF